MIKNASTHKALEFIRTHPDIDVNQIAEGTGISREQTASILYSLHNGGYVYREKSDAHKNEVNMALFIYRFRTDKPKNERTRSIAKKSNGHANSVTKASIQTTNSVEILVAIKNTKGTTVLTLDQARDLVNQLKAIV